MTSTVKPGYLWRGVEGVGRCVGDAEETAGMLRVAACAGSVAAVGIGTADETDGGESAGCGAGWGSREQEPGNAGGVRRGGLLEDFASDGAAVVPGPGGSCSVGA